MRIESTSTSRRRLLMAAPLLYAFAAAGAASQAQAPSTRLPWREAGLTARQAAALLLDRFAFGARPGDVERVAAMGPDVWFERQLAAELPEGKLERKLAPLRSLTMDSERYLSTYPPRAVLLREAREAGVVPGKSGRGGALGVDAAPDAAAADAIDLDKREVREKLLAFARERGYRPQREALGELLAQKVYRAVYAENQLREVLTDFWFNHFNVAITKNQARPFVMSYERDAVRPHVLGSFRDLLEATARHPAMLLYLDNAQSTAGAGVATTMADALDDRRYSRGPFSAMRRRRMDDGIRRPGDPQTGRKRGQGVNENYARELMELHTLGVDGGYTQQDVGEVARALTGWTVYPPGPLRPNVKTRVERALRADVGFAVQGDFLFRADTHDAGPKTVLGHRLAAGRGIEDGEEVLDLLASQPATARLLARQLAVRFVSDEPPAALVDRLARTYLATRGDLRATLRALAAAPEFWAPAARRQKIKSPFEVAVSALRATGAEVTDPLDTVRWIARMGQQLYAFQAPTGWPDRASQWVNSGALLNRMNFGLQLAAGRVAGVTLDLAQLDGGREPESPEAALSTFVPLLLPERDAAETARLLTRMLRDPALAGKVVQAIPEGGAEAEGTGAGAVMEEEATEFFGEQPLRPGGRGYGAGGERKRPPIHLDPPTPLEQVVGLILGSPAFQRR